MNRLGSPGDATITAWVCARHFYGQKLYAGFETRKSDQPRFLRTHYVRHPCKVAPKEGNAACAFTSSIPVKFLSAPPSLPRAGYMFLQPPHQPALAIPAWSMRRSQPSIPTQIQPGDVVGIGIHTANALRGYEIGNLARERGAYVVFGGIHATLYPNEAHELGGAHAVVKGDGDVVWSKVLADCAQGTPLPVYEGGRIEASEFLPARWDLVPRKSYMWASVQTVRGCPKHCSFCSVWRTDGQRPRQRTSDVVIEEIVQLRRLGFRFIALADDNFYPVTLTDLRLAEEQHNTARAQ